MPDEHLISASELAGRLGDPWLRLADVRWYVGEPGRNRAEYAAGHLPGAVFLDVDTDLSAPAGPGRHPLPDPGDLAGLLAERGFDRRYLTSVAAMAAGLLIVFAGGVSWLSLYTPGPDAVMTAVRAGFLPFVPADIVKILAGATVLPQAWKFLGTRHLT